MQITKAAIKKNYITLTIIAILIIAGIVSYIQLPKSENPGFVVKQATIITYLPGASPEDMARLVSDEIEETIKEIPELDYVESVNKTGFSLVTVNIDQKHRDLRPVWDSMRRKINDIKHELPDNVQGPYINDEYGDVFGTIIGVSGEDYSYGELEEIAKSMKDELLTIDEVAKVDLVGQQDERIFIDYDNDKLAEMGVSPYQLEGLLQNRNIILPGGSINAGQERIFLEPTGDYKKVDSIAETLITLPNGSQAYLGDLAEVKEDYVDPPQSKMRISNQSGLGLAISLKDGEQITSLGPKVREKIASFKKDYPAGIDIETVYFQSDLVEDKVKNFTANLVQSTLIVILVLLVFLGIKEGILVATLVPVVICITFFLMSLFKIGIDQVSLSALIISLGMLVDNSVVVAEAIITKCEEGMDKFEAAISAGKELKVPLLIASIVTCTAFSPIAFAKASVGEFAGAIFKVVALALMTSWGLALTMVPLFTVLFLNIGEKEQHHYNNPIYRGHQFILRKLMKHKVIFVILLVILLFTGLKGMGYVPKVFMAKDNKSVMTFEAQLPKGTSIETTEEAARSIDNYIAQELEVPAEEKAVNPLRQLLAGGTITEYQQQGILDWATFIGEGAPRFTLAYQAELNSPEYIYMLIDTTSAQQIDKLSQQLEQYTKEKFPGAEVTAKKLEFLPVGKPIQIRLFAEDKERLAEIAAGIKQKLRDTSGLTSITDDWGLKTKKLMVDIKQERLQKAGLTNKDVALSLQAVLDGVPLTKYRNNEDQIPVVLRGKEARNISLDQLKTTKVYSQKTGKTVALKQVADINVNWEPSVITRRNGSNMMTIKANINNPNLTAREVISDLEPWLEQQAQDWGPGYKYEFGGEIESSQESNEAINEQLPLAALIILLMLVIQFNSYKKPVTIILALPLVIIGVAIGLLVTGMNFGFMETLGVISLVGIIVNNSIVLIERIEIELDEFNRPPAQAVLGAAMRRLRPIFLTSATTMCGLLPLWLSGDPLFGGMAVTLIFGLAFGLLITLVVVPVMYTIIHNIKFNDTEEETVTND
ncbi:MAG: efflux RND transporter permease subunit [Bacillota bacterium]